ncbi:MAG: peptide chain release factor N(5)-glutamine methyltransferase [Kribbellaceae bacterium]
MRLRDAIAQASRRLERAGVPSPRYDAELLLARVLAVPRGRLGLAQTPTADQITAFDALITRRERREPLQHILGATGFRLVDVVVGPGVFVPRPETEELAGWAVGQLRRLRSPVAVDLCTGSGAIALALSTEVPSARVYAVELSATACDYARRNLTGSPAGRRVDLRCDDIADALGELDGTVDVVVANPPYIPTSAQATVEPEARDYDPPLALWSGPDGLDGARRVEAAAARLLRPGGRVGCEHADVQHETALEVFARSGRWVEVTDMPDLTGRPRFVTAVRR